MRKIIKICTLSFAVTLTIGIVTACGNKAETLSAPNYARADFWKVSWFEVENASGYVLKLPTGEELETTELSMDLFEYCAPNETYTFQVKAKGDGVNYSDSDWLSIDYTSEKVTSGLIYELLDDNTYCVSIEPSDIPANGELVLPDEYKGVSVTKYREYFSGDLVIGNQERLSYKKIRRIRLSSKLKDLSSGLYQSSIEEIYLPNTLKVIGAAFEECTKLKEIVIPDGVKTIGARAFYGSTCLEKIVIPDTIIQIGSTLVADEIGAFDNTPWYENQPDGMIYVGKVAYRYKGQIPENTSLELRADIQFITANAFKNQTNLVSITIPEGVTEILYKTFYGCTNLATVNLPQSLVCIRREAFAECKSLKQIDLPENLQSLMYKAFANSGLMRIEFPSTFKWSSELGAVNSLFFNCKDLQEIIFTASIENFPAGIYANTGIVSCEMPDGLEQTISFMNCEKLEYVVIPTSLKKFYWFNFSGTESLSALYYKGTAEEWTEITFTGEVQEGVTIYFYCESEPTEEGNFWRYVDGVPTVWA